MSFRLFGVDVEIQIAFWFTAFLIGLPLLQDPTAPPGAIVVRMAVVLFSILLHEYGHAAAIMRHHIEPSITLHWMGGRTMWRAILPLRRVDLVIISAAGPFAGFAVAGAIYALRRLAPGFEASLPPLAQLAVQDLWWINFMWGIVNLLPVLPLDGGHVLEHALGPKRIRITAVVSLVVGVVMAVIAYRLGTLWGMFIFASGALRSYQLLTSSGAAPSMPAPRAAPARQEYAVDPQAQALLRSARQALADDEVDRAVALAHEVLAGQFVPGERPVPPHPIAAHAAHEIVAWAHLLRGRTGQAKDALAEARRIAPPDPALLGGVLLATRELKEARRVLEAARSAGDERKEVVGPLIQVLLEQGELARAAAVAFDIVESLSEEDARKMAAIAFDGGSYEWSARLYEAVFNREGRADDAYDAARALAKDGERDQALRLLRRAVEAGFTDRARAWSDAALEALRGERGLEEVLPRP